MARLRLGYTKSRGGCLRCKQRRVKCDEQRPCKACARHGVECSLVTGQLGSTSQGSRSSSTTPSVTSPSTQIKPPDPDFNTRPTPPTARPTAQQLPSISQLIGPPNQLTPYPTTAPISSVPSPSLGGSPHTGPGSPDPFPYFAKFTNYEGEQDPLNWASDLELLHHYTTCSYKTLGKGYPPEIWSIEVPKLAFANTYLLHELLAIAAFHIAYLRPERRKEYTVKATHHQSRAIEGIRSVLTNSAYKNCHALFAASIFLFVSSLAASRPSVDDTITGGSSDFSLDNLVDVFLLLKGVRGVIDDANEELHNGPFRVVFLPVKIADPSPGLTRLMKQLQRFAGRLPTIMASTHDPNGPIIELEVQRMIECIEQIGQTSASPEYHTIAAWPLSLSPEFVGLLRSRAQPALAVLCYYCVILHCTEDSYWFTKGWGMCVMKDIVKYMTPPWNQDSAWAEGWITAQVAAD